MMLLLQCLICMLFALSSASVCLASSWRFTDAIVSIQDKGAGVGGGFKQNLVEHRPLKDSLGLAASESLKIVLTAQDGKTPKRPHQASLMLKDSESGLDVSYPFSVKENGKAKIDLTYKDLPSQFLATSKPIQVNLVLASFGASTGYDDCAFFLDTSKGSSSPPSSTQLPLRYRKLEGIHHIFKQDPKSPYLVFSLTFTAAVLVTLTAIAGLWLYLGANLNHFSVASRNAPLSHILFFGAIVGIEGIFFLYYTSWNLFQTLPVLFAVGTVAFFSGSGALSEVQERRLTGLR